MDILKRFARTSYLVFAVILIASSAFATNYYVTATAGGGGDGSSGNPWTITEAAAVATFTTADIVWVQAGTYTLTSALTITDTDPLWIGYNTTIADLDSVWGEGSGATAKPVINTNGTFGGNIVTFSCGLYNIVIDGTGVTSAGNLFNGAAGTAGRTYNCVAKNSNANNNSYGFSNLTYCGFCIATSCATGGFNGSYCYGCLAYSNTAGSGRGFYSCTTVNCIAYANKDGFVSLARFAVNCTSTTNTSSGFASETSGVTIINCISVGNTAWGYDPATGNAIYINCSAYGNGSGTIDTTNNYIINLDTTSDPALTNPAGLDFTPGSLMANKGAYYNNFGTSSGLDLGAIQIYTAPSSIPTFAGITQLEAVGGGCLRATWSAGTGTITGYNIYVRQGASPNFSSTYLKMRVDNSSTEAIFRCDSDNTTYLTDQSAVYVGVRAENSGTEDTNTEELYVIPTGDGTTYMNLNDIVAIGV